MTSGKPTLQHEKNFFQNEIKPILFIICFSMIIRAMIVDHYHVPSESMYPTIKINDRVVVNKAAFGLRIPMSIKYIFGWGKINRGDVVIFRAKRTACDTTFKDIISTPFRLIGYQPPKDKIGCTLIKRVTGIPGDTVEAIDGKLKINGTKVDIEYHEKGGFGEYLEHLPDDKHSHIITLEALRYNSDAYMSERTIPEGEYLMMGDNRGNSNDGRVFGFVPHTRILGRASGIYRRGAFKWYELWKGWHIPMVSFDYED